MFVDLNIITLKSKISNFPKSPGVYEFRDKKGKILYIGKATNLRDRAGSYFAKNLDPRIARMVADIADIRIHETDSVLEALILEANLIKKHQPKYNVLLKDDKSFAYAVITKEEFPRVLIARETELQKNVIPTDPDVTSGEWRNLRELCIKRKTKRSLGFLPRRQAGARDDKVIFGPYTSKKQLDIALKLIRKIFPYHSARQVSRNCCFEYQIGLCPGPYAGAISKKDYLKNIHGIEMILRGKKKKLLLELKKQMREYSRNNEFEKAAEIRNRIFALEHIRNVALITSESSTLGGFPRVELSGVRIEGYDVSNIGGDYAVGSMVVFANGKPDKNEYRKFKIKTVKGIDDVGMMREVLIRRFRNNWPKPDLILLDGGKGHLGMAERLLRDLKLKIPIVAVAKGPTRKISNFQPCLLAGRFLIPNKIPKSQIGNIFDNKALLANITSEAHRFAISYHKKLRIRNWKDK